MSFVVRCMQEDRPGLQIAVSNLEQEGGLCPSSLVLENVECEQIGRAKNTMEQRTHRQAVNTLVGVAAHTPTSKCEPHTC